MKHINKVILASIFVVPMASIIPIYGTIIWYPQLLALMALGFACISMTMWDKNKYISIFLMYATLSYLVVCNQSPRAMLCLITGSGSILFTYLISKSSVNIFKSLLWFSILNFVYVIAQAFKLDPVFITSHGDMIDRTVGFMGSRNQLGIFSACSGILLTYLSPWFLLLSIPILLVKCSSAFAGIMAGIASWCFFMGHKVLAIAFIISILISIPIFIFFKSSLVYEFKERLSIWHLSIEQTVSGKMEQYNDKGEKIREIKCNPLFGYGIGNFFVMSPKSQGKTIDHMYSHRYEHAHNDLVEAFFEFGYIGLALIILAVSKIVSDFVHCVHKTNTLIVAFSTLICLTVCSLGVYVFHAPVSLFLVSLVLGLFYKEINDEKSCQITTNPA
jgi:hypothetical protein